MARSIASIDEALDRISLQERTAFGGGEAQRAAQLRVTDRLALCEFPIKRNSNALFIRREGLQMRLQRGPIFLHVGDRGHVRYPRRHEAALPSPKRLACMGGQGTEPKEQNTQQSRGLGRSFIPQPVQT